MNTVKWLSRTHFPNWHTTLFERPYNVIWTLYGRWFEVLWQLGWIGKAKNLRFLNEFFDFHKFQPSYQSIAIINFVDSRILQSNFMALLLQKKQKFQKSSIRRKPQKCSILYLRLIYQWSTHKLSNHLFFENHYVWWKLNKLLLSADCVKI